MLLADRSLSQVLANNKVYIFERSDKNVQIFTFSVNSATEV